MKLSCPKGVKLADIVRGFSYERRTGLFAVVSKKGNSFLYFEDGMLWNAVSGKLRGVPAFYEVLSEKEFQINELPIPKRKIKRENFTNTETLLDNWQRGAIANQPSPVESDGCGAAAVQKQEVAPKIEMPESSSSEVSSETTDGYSREEFFSQDSNVLEAARRMPTPINIGEAEMEELNNILKKMSAVEGFVACAIVSPEGELLASVNSAGIKLQEVGALANDILLKSQNAAELMGVGRAQCIHLEAPKGHALARCLNEATDYTVTASGRAHFHVIMMIAKEGNIALAKMRLNNAMSEIAPHLR